MIYFTKPSGRVKQANPVFAPPSASNWLASLAVVGLFASPAFGQEDTTNEMNDDQVADCGTDVREGEVAGGCQLQYSSSNGPATPRIPPVMEVPAVAATYRLTINGIVYEATGAITPDGEPDVLTLETPQAVDTDEDGSLTTVTFSYVEGAELDLVILTDGVPAVPAVPEVPAIPETFNNERGMGSVAVGTGAIVKGAGSVAVGEGAVVGVNVPATMAVPEVTGIYTVTINGRQYQVSTGTVNAGDGTPDVLTLVTPETVDTDGDMNLATVTFRDAAGDSLNLRVDRTPVPAVPVTMASIAAVDRGTAIGAGSSATGNGGVAIGAGATAAANGIAIGTTAAVDADGNPVNVSAGENQVRIGSTQTDVRIGAYDLSGLTQIPQIAVNSAAIARNTADIETNRAGVASAVAIANLPSVQGPTGGWSLALGSFDGETAIAGGINFDVFTSSIVKISVASSDGETSAGVGFGMGF